MDPWDLISRKLANLLILDQGQEVRFGCCDFVEEVWRNPLLRGNADAVTFGPQA
jgi:hypothetical protein